ncbi:mandelate racemase/muconate lactonizing enzyme family protein [Novibacillus thermophilus]|uniref:mandelate racemase/muconate lactonizing enzyme family protein n=1 Tax=Novibacillus thermophilus TaxID=1471761 RepID=UPI003001FB65
MVRFKRRGLLCTPEYRSIYSRNLESLIVKLTTDNGLEGWGEALAPVGPEIPGNIISSLFKPFLLGKDPRQINVIWNKLYDSMRERGYFTGFMVDAITAVDVALWDLYGKSLDLPVHQLLGGAFRSEIPAYVSGLPEKEMAKKIERAQQWKQQGFNAIKLHLGYGIKEDVEIMNQLREHLGADFRLMVDAHWQYTVPDAIRLGRELEKLNIEFLEAPTLPEDVDGHVEITRSLDMAVAIGEAKRTKFQFKERLVKRAADVLQPDVGRVGITEMRNIAVLAETFGIPIAPHLSVGLGICIAATLQVSAAINNFYILEFQPSVFPNANKLVCNSLVCEKGRYLLPDGPGLGVNVDEAFIRENCSNPLLLTNGRRLS